jgi:signal transduction histidine kinase
MPGRAKHDMSTDEALQKRRERPGRRRERDDDVLAPAAVRDLAHELRTPLAAIQSMAEALAGGHLGAPGSAKHQAYLADIAATARHALAVVQGMLQAQEAERSAHGREGGTAHGGRARRDGRATCDANQVVAGVLDAMGAMAREAGIAIDAELAPELPAAGIEATALRQMVMNLAANVLAHAGRGASARVTTGVSRNAGGGGEVWIEVADDGPGIAGEVVRELADGGPGEAGGRAGQGIGLRLTQELARRAGGRLELRAGRGARARIVVPVPERG